MIEKRNAEAAKDYQKKVAEEQSAKAYDKALEEQNAKKAAYDAKVAEKAAADKTNAEAKAGMMMQMAVYNTAKAQYDKDLQEYQN